MSSLNASLAVALSGLSAEQGALEATTNNVANVNTPGYSRQVPRLESSDPVVIAPLTLGTGVRLRTIESIRDRILEAQIQLQMQTRGQLGALVSALTQTQTNFTATAGDIGTAISKFFDSINHLSTSPADLSLRQNVLTAARNLASAFNIAANHLSAQRSSQDQSVEQAVGQINELTRQIAQLNTQITALENVGQSAGSFLDQRTQLINQLSSLIDVSVIPSDHTITITTARGTALVAGEKSFSLTTAPDVSGRQHVFSQGTDITGTIASGELGGILQARDQQVPAIQTQLDTLAYDLAGAVNAVQTAGYDRNGNGTSGVSLFTLPASFTGAASSISVAITDPALLAASSDGSAGSNGNAEAMYALRNQAIVAGQSASDYYSRVIFHVGNAVANANAQQSASDLVLQQLNNQRSSVSGVSLDEEAANLIRYQQAYAASAKVVSTINAMMETVIAMKS